MATITLNLVDSFATLRTKFNNLSTDVGDLTLLTTDSTSSIVTAINSVDSNLGEIDATASSRIPDVYDLNGTLLNP